MYSEGGPWTGMDDLNSLLRSDNEANGISYTVPATDTDPRIIVYELPYGHTISAFGFESGKDPMT